MPNDILAVLTKTASDGREVVARPSPADVEDMVRSRNKVGLARYVSSLTKRADVGGDGQDSSYEQAMSDIADIVLKDRAPALRQYEVGFQLIDRDEDGDSHRAIGVKVFKVGKSWLMVPVFFLNGAVKGTELLYLKNQDVFVPLQEDWIRHILNKGMQSMGSSVDKYESSRSASRPDLFRLVRPPAKYASYMPTASRIVDAEVMPSWAHSLTTNPLDEAGVSLPEFLKAAGAPAVAALARFVQEVPSLTEDLIRFHGIGIVETIKQAAEIAPFRAVPGPTTLDAMFTPDRHPIQDGRLRIKWAGGDLGWSMLDDLRKEADDADRKGPYLFDDRDEDAVSKAIAEGESIVNLINPDATGIYKVLVAPGKYEKCLVAVAPWTSDGHAEYATIVRLSDRAYVNCLSRHVWVDGREDHDRKEWADFIADLPDASAPADESESDYSRATMYLGGDPHPAATAPMQERGAVGGSDTTVYRVWFPDCRGDHDWDRPADGGWHRLPDNSSSGGGNDHVVIGSRHGGRLRVAEGCLLVPAGFKALRVKRPGDGEILMPGNPDLRLAAFKKAAASLEVSRAAGGYRLNGRKFAADEALVYLVADVGLREKQARAILETSNAAALGDSTRWLVKLADPYLSTRETPAPPLPEPWWTSQETLSDSIPGTEYQEEERPVDSMRANPGDLTGYDVRQPDDQMIQHVQQAARTGQKEVFDTSMIGNILQTTQSDLQVDRHLGPIFSGNDAIGRILMSLYWHRKQFADRYGDQDVDAIEDQLRNCFNENGKLILNLKQKTVRSPLDTQHGLDLDLDDV